MVESASNQAVSTSSKRAEKSSTSDSMSVSQPNGITAISVSGYKSLADKSRIEIRPLTLLAGSNSSGKSSITQPMLLMKQTLEATYDPGALLLNGPNLKFTAANQIFSNLASESVIERFEVCLEINNSISLTNIFGKRSKKRKLELLSMAYESASNNSNLSLKESMGHEEIYAALSKDAQAFFDNFIAQITQTESEILSESQILPVRSDSRRRSVFLEALRNRCFFEIALSSNQKSVLLSGLPYSDPASIFERHIQEVIHVPGLRGNPSRTYKTTAVGGTFPGTFETYVASVIRSWQDSKRGKQLLKELGKWLQELGLTCRVETKKIDDTQVELRVGRLAQSTDGRRKDMVNIADVGFGVSQVLPVLVSLLVARPGQLVYIEQPEIHLHPRAQVALAGILCDAANRGVKVIAETHSESLLIAIQSMVAEGKMYPDSVKLHWFTRGENGSTKISSADLDEAGAFGDWPEDFAEVSMNLENRYLSAAESRLWN